MLCDVCEASVGAPDEGGMCLCAQCASVNVTGVNLPNIALPAPVTMPLYLQQQLGLGPYQLGQKLGQVLKQVPTPSPRDVLPYTPPMIPITAAKEAAKAFGVPEALHDAGARAGEMFTDYTDTVKIVAVAGAAVVLGLVVYGVMKKPAPRFA